MLTNQLLEPIPLWVLFIFTFLTLLLAIEAGYQINPAIRRKSPDKIEVDLGTMVADSLGLLVFLLAFTVDFAVNINGQRSI
jgi:hypothetical protein